MNRPRRPVERGDSNPDTRIYGEVRMRRDCGSRRLRLMRLSTETPRSRVGPMYRFVLCSCGALVGGLVFAASGLAAVGGGGSSTNTFTTSTLHHPYSLYYGTLSLDSHRAGGALPDGECVRDAAAGGPDRRRRDHDQPQLRSQRGPGSGGSGP